LNEKHYRKRKSFYPYLKDQLKKEVPLDVLPHRLRVLGHVAIIWLTTEALPYKNLIGQTVLEYHPRIRSVIRRTAAISGPFRQPSVELIAGSPNTETSFKENGIHFHIDPMKVMFSLGNKAERIRMSRVGKAAFVIDMFAGIGQFSLPIAVHSRPRILHAIEWNPDAFHYLEQNIHANNVNDRVKAHFGDTEQITPTISKGEADIVIMGLIKGTAKYLVQGISALRSGGILYFHEISSHSDLHKLIIPKMHQIASKNGRQIELTEERQIKTYNQKQSHFVLVVRVN
jgi:tRNA wybutosine-synthesizing protein 2